MLLLRWLASGTVRHAVDLHKHVRKLLRAQCDLLSAEAIRNITQPNDELKRAIDTGAKKEDLLQRMKEVEEAANKNLKPYPDASMRENVEVFLVAIAVAVAIRTFVLQPFKIPTGSMQPTLYGVMHENLLTDGGRSKPDFGQRLKESFFEGASYHELLAKSDGVLSDGEFKRVFPLVYRLRFEIGGVPHTDYFFMPADKLDSRLALEYGKSFHKGDPVYRIKVNSGDHLFVDRLTYNFRRPQRGDIFVFATKGLSSKVPQDQFYIKRLVGLPNEKMRIGNDRHLVIDGRRLTASDYGFENVYGFDPQEAPKFNGQEYLGHINASIGRVPAEFFPDGETEFQVRPKRYMAMGDNTLNSHDSRDWGDVPQENIIGRSYFVYWPLTSRFGWKTK